jgi:uncharacterized protein (DUF1697 family)
MTIPTNRCIAFLRAINVGGHTVKMDTLRALCQELGFVNVETFIASGNLVFETESGDPGQIEKTLSAKLEQGLGYPVAAFIRTPAELSALAGHQAFPQAALQASQAFNLAFLERTPTPAEIDRLQARKSEIDDFHVHERAIYWLCKLKQSESTFSNAVLEKTIGQQSTLRGMQTVRKMAAKYAGFTG